MVLAHGIEITSTTEKRLNSLQNLFVRLILRVGPGSPVSAIMWDTSLLDMQLRVWREKLMMIIHIRSFDAEAIASQIYQEQKDKNWPGLAEETRVISEALKIEDCNTTMLGKQKYRELVTKACHQENKVRLRSKAIKVKCARIQGKEYGRKTYLQENCIETTRAWFKTCFGLLPFSGNFSHNKKYAKTEWLCQCKQEKEEEGHILSGKCNVYSDLISQFGDLAEDKNLVKFF